MIVDTFEQRVQRPRDRAAADRRYRGKKKRVRRYQSLSQAGRHHRRKHAPRVRAVAGLVNRRLRRLAVYRERLAA